MKILNTLYRLSFLTTISITFVFGGLLQLLLGIPNTLLTYISIGILFFYLIFYFYSKKLVIVNKTVLIFVLFAIVIVLSGIINATKPIKVAIYLLYALLPLSVYLFFRINSKENYLSKLFINKLFFYIACIQLPIMLIQRVAYPILLKINNSGQDIIEADIMFGSFFVKADHSLGFFMLFNVFNLVLNNKFKEITKYPLLMFAYFGLTILLSESNITKLIFSVFTAYSIYVATPKKIKVLATFFIVLFSIVAVSFLKNTKPVEAELVFIEKEYNPRKSYSNFERGIAKRPQVIIVYLTKIPIKIVGDGPYSYFNILKGKFTKTKHFSQIIWTYADLGIIGFIIFLMTLRTLVKRLNLERRMALFFFMILIVYSFMTTMYSDIAIMIIFLSLMPMDKKRI
jgi:hypothetical protein